MSGQARLHTTPDSGQSWNPVHNLRTVPGGPDTGQSDRSASGNVACNTAGGALTIPLWTTAAGKTGCITDLELYLTAAATGVTVLLQVGGVTVWQCPALVNTNPPTVMRRRWPILVPPGQAVTLVVGQASVAANLIFNLGAWEES
jgi:hypothetical protein